MAFWRQKFVCRFCCLTCRSPQPMRGSVLVFGGVFFIKKMKEQTLIQAEDYIIFKKEDFMKLYQVRKGRQVWFGKQVVNLDGAIGHPFETYFEIKDKKLVAVDRKQAKESRNQLDGNHVESKDNRNLIDDGKSQKLTKNDIELFKKEGIDGKDIIDQLIVNSSTFNEKTDYSKHKYLVKKKSKYMKQILVCRPSTRLLCDMYLSQGPIKVLNMRSDSLAQILSMANVHSGGKYLVFDNCMGLLVGAALERLNGNGQVVQLYSGNPPNKNTIESFNFSEEQRNPHLVMNATNLVYVNEENLFKLKEREISTTNRMADDHNNKNTDVDPGKLLRKEKRILQDNKVLNLLNEKNMDGLIIASRFHPTKIVEVFLGCLAWSRSCVIYSPYKEPLIDCYQSMKRSGNVVFLNLFETWCRKYQVLSNRTHPDMLMNGAGGFILSGIHVEKNPFLSSDDSTQS